MAPLKVNVGTRNPLKVEAVRAVFARAFGPVEVEAVEVDPGVPKEPFGEEIARGAVRRAREALKRLSDNYPDSKYRKKAKSLQAELED